MQTVDVLPTIADVLGVDVPWKVDGASLLQPRVREQYLLVGDRETFRPDVDELLARRATVVRAIRRHCSESDPTPSCSGAR